MKNIENLSIKDILEDPFVPRSLRLVLEKTLASSPEELVNILLDELREISRYMEGKPKEFFTMNEDQISVHMVLSLKGKGYDADHDTTHGGHCDFLVKLKSKRVDEYIWIGEAKIGHDPGYIYGGYQQLLSRYSSGSHSQGHGGILIYYKKENVAKLMSNWKDYLEGKKLNGYCCKDVGGCLEIATEQIHPKSGRPFFVHHFPIMLSFNPEK